MIFVAIYLYIGFINWMVKMMYVHHGTVQDSMKWSLLWPIYIFKKDKE